MPKSPTTMSVSMLCDFPVVRNMSCILKYWLINKYFYFVRLRVRCCDRDRFSCRFWRRLIEIACVGSADLKLLNSKDYNTWRNGRSFAVANWLSNQIELCAFPSCCSSKCFTTKGENMSYQKEMPFIFVIFFGTGQCFHLATKSSVGNQKSGHIKIILDKTRYFQ